RAALPQRLEQAIGLRKKTAVKLAPRGRGRPTEFQAEVQSVGVGADEELRRTSAAVGVALTEGDPEGGVVGARPAVVVLRQPRQGEAVARLRLQGEAVLPAQHRPDVALADGPAQ